MIDGLVCPLSRAPVIEHDGWIWSTDQATRRRFPIRNGFPVMLIDESEEVEESTWREAMTASDQATT